MGTTGACYRLKAQVAVLKEVEKDYPYCTISCAIKQLESRINEIEKTWK